MSASRVLWNDALDRAQPFILRLAWKVTAAVTVSNLYDCQGSAVLTAFGAISAQSTIDTFLGTTSEFDYLAFDATALGADIMAGIVNMNGQCQKLLWMEATCSSGTAGATKVVVGNYASSALTASTLVTECAKGSSGNVAFKANFGNSPDFDALTDALITVDLAMYLK